MADLFGEVGGWEILRNGGILVMEDDFEMRGLIAYYRLC